MTPPALSIYTALLALYPRPMREDYGEAMVQLFTDRYRDERPGGDIFRFARFWGGMIGDLVKTAFAERMESLVSNVKRQWWKWGVGLVAAFYGALVVEAGFRLVLELLGGKSQNIDLLALGSGIVLVAAIVAGLRLISRRPRLGSGLIVFGLLPAMASGFIFYWFPPMYLLSLIAIYVAVKALMEAGRLTRDLAATA